MSEELRIVIVEDDPGLSELIKRRLQREGYDCFVFHRGDDTLSWLASNQADLMLVDLVLPDVTGEELIVQLQRNNIRIPFIVATGQGSEATAVKMIKQGARDYLVKNSQLLEVLPATIEMVWREVQLESLLDRARDRIRIQNATLSTVFDLSPNGILVGNGIGEIVYSNPQFCELWGMSAESISKDCESVLREIAAKTSAPDELLSAILDLPDDTKGRVVDEIQIGDRVLELHVAPLEDRQHGPAGRIWYFLDITLHKQAQHALEEARVQTEQNAQIKSRLFALVSHDVKSPLNSINGFLEMLQDTELSEDQKEFVNVISTSTEHLTRLMGDILDLVRLESGKFGFECSDFPSKDLFDDCVASLQADAGARGIAVACEIDDSVPDLIHGDMVRLRQIIMNLLGNALKFTHEGSVVLRAELAEDDMIRVEVADTGIGVAKDAQSVIFAAFSQADASINKKYGGTGLGLAITKELVSRMGGTISMESEVGAGTTFTFTIPVHAKV